MSTTIRTPEPGEFPRWWAQMRDGFGLPPQHPDQAAMSGILEMDRLRLALDGDRVVGTIGAFTAELAIHGHAVPVAATGLATVRPDHAGRGLLRQLIRELNVDARRNEEWVALAYTSHGGLHRRNGYGIASWHHTVSVPSRDLLTIDAAGDRVVEVDREDARATFPAMHAAAMRQRSAGLVRPPQVWRAMLGGEPDAEWGGGWSALRTAAIPGEGYVVHRSRAAPQPHLHGELQVVELVATTPAASGELWRHLGRMDPHQPVHAVQRPADDPLPHLVRDQYAPVTTTANSMWLRVVDVGEAWRNRPVAGRGGAVVVGIADQTEPTNDGNWRLAVTGDVAEADRVDAHPDLSMDVSDLGAVWLGGTRVSTLVAAGRIEQHTPGAGNRLQELLWGPSAPWASWWF